MPLKGPNAEDLRKVSSEINQIVNQRFLITTLAITMFGVMIAWMIPKTTPILGDPIGGITFALAMLLSLLLCGLYLWSHFLKRTLRVFTTYLIETNSSNWEIDWQSFRQESHFTYTKAQTIVFLLLNVVAFVYPFLFSSIFSLKVEPVSGAIFCAMTGTITTIMMYLIGFHGLFDSENKAASRWRALNSK
jgi:hypothetical protein